jgi:uncharacterized membrane protein
MKSLIATAAAVIAFATPFAPAWGADHRYESVTFPGAVSTTLFAINNLRQYVGAEREASGVHHAIFNDGTRLALLDLAALGAINESWAFSINTHADIAGTFVDTSGESHGYLRHADGSVETLDYPGGNNTTGYGVNDRGTVIGLYSDAAGVVHAYERLKGVYLNIDLPNGFQTVPLSVNNSNQIVGGFQPSADVTGYGFVRQPDGAFTLHNAPGAPAQSTQFISINNRREVLGAWFDADGNPANFLRKQAKYVPVVLPDSFGALYTSAQTINDGNDIVGYYADASGFAKGWTAFAKHPGAGR